MLLAYGFIVLVELLLGELALLIPVAIAAVALAVGEVRLHGLLAILPPFPHNAVEATFHERVFGFRFAIGMRGAGRAGERGVGQKINIVLPNQIVVGHFNDFRLAGRGKEGQKQGEQATHLYLKGVRGGVRHVLNRHARPPLALPGASDGKAAVE